MSELFGFTRNVVKERYALLTPSGFVPSSLPGWEKAVCHVLISPAMGARFTQLLAILDHDGQCVGNIGAHQYFIYVLNGAASIVLDERRHRLEARSFDSLPPAKDLQLKSGGAGTRVLIFQNPYQPLAGVGRPAALVGQQREIKGVPFLGNEDARLQVLLPDEPAFDLAVNIFT